MSEFLGGLLGLGNRTRRFARGLLSDPSTTLADYLTTLNEEHKEANKQRYDDTRTMLYRGVMREDPSYLAARDAAERRSAERAIDFIGAGATKAAKSAMTPNKVLSRQTVRGPIRNAYPGIYKEPSELVREVRVAPEDPMLKRLFGVTRDDLYEMSRRTGNIPGVIPGAAANPTGSASAAKIMVPQNERRLVDALSYARKESPELFKGMHSWYTMDPMFNRMVELVGPEQAIRDYKRINAFGGIESPNMPVLKEIDRATAANYLFNQGRWGDWSRFGGMKNKQSLPYIPADMKTIPGRVGHNRSAMSQSRVLNWEDRHGGMMSPKAPVYIDASGVPQTGFQTDTFIGDAHISRSLGLADVRTDKGFAESVSTPELLMLRPWYRDKIAGALGMEAVPTQGFQWGLYAPQTGVKTPVGAPKLELLAQRIANKAGREGVSPETMRDLVLMGRQHTGKADQDLLALLGIGSAGLLGYAAHDR